MEVPALEPHRQFVGGDRVLFVLLAIWVLDLSKWRIIDGIGGRRQVVRHWLPKPGFRGFESRRPLQKILSAMDQIHCRFFVASYLEGVEPLRWNSVKKTCQWHVFRNSPAGACAKGLSVCKANAESRRPLHRSRSSNYLFLSGLAAF